MKKLSSALGALACLFAFAPALAEQAAREYDMTEICQPDRAHVRRYYPQRALARGQSGEAVLDCAVGEDFYPSTCHIKEENPARFEFGRAALTLSCLTQIRQIPADAVEVPNQHLYIDENGQQRAEITVRFRLSNTPPPDNIDDGRQHPHTPGSLQH